MVMIRSLLAAPLFILVAASSLRAQSPVQVIDSFSVRTNDARDNGVPNLRFGFGTDYTDGPDTSNGKGEFPFPFIGGPTGFAMAFYVKDFLGDPGFDYRDVRGLPDSVISMGLTHFTITYTIRIQAGIGLPIIRTSGALSRGIDSIVLSSTQPGANYHHVFYPEGGVDTVTRREISELLANVYYDYFRAASAPHHGDAPSVVVSPNPASPGNVIRLNVSEIDEAGRVILSDMMGRMILDRPVGPGALLQLPEDILPGCYIVRQEDRGVLRSVSRLIVTR